MASVLQTRLGTSDRDAKDVEAIIAACRRGRDLTQNLLSFARRGPRESELLSLNKLIGDLWEKGERTQSVLACVPERAAASVVEHTKIIEALKAKNLEQAENLMKNQKSRTMADLKKYIHNNK